MRYYGLIHEVQEDVLPMSKFDSIFKKFNQNNTQTSLFEIAEAVIREFKLASLTTETAYIHSFQDILHSYTQKNSASIHLFLEWWDENKDKLYIAQSETKGCMQAMTIHKSKGLQFKVVVMPFISWAFYNTFHRFIIETKGSEFSDLPLLELPVSKGLAQTQFSAQYVEEMTQIFLDNLNLFYVACTRAEDVLCMAYPEHRKAKTTLCMDGFVKRILAQTEGATEDGLIIGELEKIEEEPIGIEGQIVEKSYPVFFNQKYIITKPRSSCFF